MIEINIYIIFFNKYIIIIYILKKMSNHRNLKDLFPSKFTFVKPKLVMTLLKNRTNKMKDQNKTINHH